MAAHKTNLTFQASGGNREYKSDLFGMLMEIPEYALDTYNGINATSYDDPADIEYCRLEHSFSLTLRNDASFLIHMHLNLYGHQSTYSPNLPLRGLIYFTDILRDYVKQQNLFGRKTITIPTPHFVVFYNGTEARPEVETLKLSSAFAQATDHPELELTCRIYNINPEIHPAVLTKCRVLREYMFLVDTIRELLSSGILLEDAINQGIDLCMKEHVLEDFLREHRAEVTKVMTLDYTFEKQLEYEKRDSYEDGVEQGIARGLEQGLEQGLDQGLEQGLEQGLNQGLASSVRFLKDYLPTPEAIWERIHQDPNYANVSLDEIKQYY